MDRFILVHMHLIQSTRQIKLLVMLITIYNVNHERIFINMTNDKIHIGFQVSVGGDLFNPII